MPKFNAKMEEIKAIDDKPQEYLVKLKPFVWSRVGFSTHTKSQAITNDMCELFNSKILKFKGMPIIIMLKEIKLYVVNKFSNQRRLYQIYVNLVSPKV